MYRYNITFKYRDALSNFEERTQRCSLCANSEYEARRKCIDLYGLGIDCDYSFVSIEKQ